MSVNIKSEAKSFVIDKNSPIRNLDSSRRTREVEKKKSKILSEFSILVKFAIVVLNPYKDLNLGFEYLLRR